jgi:hypothetical protein
MPKSLSPDHPNLVLAVNRVKRIFWAWGGLYLFMALFTAAVLRGSYPLAPLPWLIAGLLIVFGRQPAYLGLVAILWGMSIVSLIPNVNTLIGPDPIIHLLELSNIEGIALGVVRVLLLIMAWNQFMFYRMLYGTEQMSGAPRDMPPIPAMFANKTGQIARIAQLVGLLGLLPVWGSILIPSDTLAINLLSLSYTTSILSIGMGVGVVFSPTTKRRIGLSAIGIGVIVFISIFIIGRLTLL